MLRCARFTYGALKWNNSTNANSSFKDLEVESRSCFQLLQYGPDQNNGLSVEMLGNIII